MVSGRKKLSEFEKRKRAKAKAMQEVKKMVKKYGRLTIQNCLNSIREIEKKREKLEELKGQVKILEKEV